MSSTHPNAEELAEAFAPAPRRHGAILYARMKASRLPGKVLMPACERPLLLLLVERLLRCEALDRIIIATTDTAEDDRLADTCTAAGVSVFRGSEEDVLDRTYRCALAHGLDPVIRFTADNPLIDAPIADRVIRQYLDHPDDYDYVSNNHPPTWPDGEEVEIVRFAALEAAWNEGREPFQREHCTPFIWDQPERFRIANVALDDDRLHAERWTLDYPEDYDFIRRVYEELYPTNPDFRMGDILSLLDRKPEIRQINAMHAGDVWYSRHAESLRTV